MVLFWISEKIKKIMSRTAIGIARNNFGIPLVLDHPVCQKISPIAKQGHQGAFEKINHPKKYFEIIFDKIIMKINSYGGGVYKHQTI